MIDDKLLAYLEHLATGRLVAVQEANVWLRFDVHGTALRECLHHARELHDVLSDYETQLSDPIFAVHATVLDAHREIGRQLVTAIRALDSIPK